MTRRPIPSRDQVGLPSASDRVPTYVDAERLCFELSISPDTMERWLKAGRLPPAKTGAPASKSRRRSAKPERPRRGIKRLWNWREVQDWIDAGGKSASVSRDLGQEITDYARAAAQGATHR